MIVHYFTVMQILLSYRKVNKYTQQQLLKSKLVIQRQSQSDVKEMTAFFSNLSLNFNNFRKIFKNRISQIISRWVHSNAYIFLSFSCIFSKSDSTSTFKTNFPLPIKNKQKNLQLKLETKIIGFEVKKQDPYALQS